VIFVVLNITQCGPENSDNVYAIYSHNIPEDRRDIPEDMNFQHRRCENFAGYNVLFVCHVTLALMIT
jgi:hypothetical protein